MASDTEANTAAERPKKTIVTITFGEDPDVEILRRMHEALAVQLTQEQLRLLARCERACQWPADAPPTMVVDAGSLWGQWADTFLIQVTAGVGGCQVSEVEVVPAEQAPKQT